MPTEGGSPAGAINPAIQLAGRDSQICDIVFEASLTERSLMPAKTNNGVAVSATQRSNRKQAVPVSYGISITNDELSIDIDVGDERGFLIKSIISIEELVAWLPQLLAARTALHKATTKSLVRRAEGEIRRAAASKAGTLGMSLPYLQGISEDALK